MLNNNQRLSLVLSLCWATFLGAVLVTGGVVWWRHTDGAAAETSFASWLIMLAFCGATGGYLRVLMSYVSGLHSGLNVVRWFYESLATVLLGAGSGVLAAAAAYLLADCFFEIRSPHWLSLSALAGVSGSLMPVIDRHENRQEGSA